MKVCSSSYIYKKGLFKKYKIKHLIAKKLTRILLLFKKMFFDQTELMILRRK